jgi:hypothetical protein
VPESISEAPSSSWIRVSVSAPYGENSLVGGYLFSGKTLTGAVEMMKE